MRRISALFLGLFLAIQPAMVLAEVNQPKAPVGLDKFHVLDAWDESCGVVHRTYYDESSEVRWGAIYIKALSEATLNPNPVLVVRDADADWGAWVDRNRDGVFDEYYPDAKALSQKYPLICHMLMR